MTPNKELRNFVWTLLNGNIMDGANIVPVYSLPASDTAFPYVHLDSINLTDESCKDNTAYSARFSIQIFDLFKEEVADWSRSEDIGYQVVENLKDIRGVTTNWKIIIANPESYDQQELMTDTKRALVTTIIMNYYIEKI